MANTPSRPSAPPATGNAGIQLKGGAAILAPINAFPNGVPGNALVLLPINPNGSPLEKKIVEGPVALQMDEVWKLLGFNGPAVQVQDDQGRPIAIGLEDLLGGLEKHWNENGEDLNRGRIFAHELMKHGRHEKAEKVLSKIVALGGDGEDWLGLGVTQLAQKKLDKAEATLKGAQNLLKDSPFPSLQLAKTMKEKGDRKAERECVERAIQVDNNSVDAWAYFANSIKEQSGDEAMVKQIEELANAPVNSKGAAPFIALQGFFANDPKDEKARERAIGFAKKAVERAPGDALALLCLSALYGAGGKVEDVVKLLAPHEAMMMRDVRIAHNYFEALFQMRDMQKITALLNKLATSQVREVKQFAIERSRAVQQMLQQQQQQLAAGSPAGGAEARVTTHGGLSTMTALSGRYRSSPDLRLAHRLAGRRVVSPTAFLTSRTRNTGPPNERGQHAPTGSSRWTSDAASTRTDEITHRTRSAAPASADTGKSPRRSGPNTRLTACGTTSPTKPMSPDTLTTAPTTAADAKNVLLSSAATSTPRLSACSSPSESTFIRAASRRRTANPTATYAATKPKRPHDGYASRVPQEPPEDRLHLLRSGERLDERDARPRDVALKTMTPARTIDVPRPARPRAHSRSTHDRPSPPRRHPRTPRAGTPATPRSPTEPPDCPATMATVDPERRTARDAEHVRLGERIAEHALGTRPPPRPARHPPPPRGARAASR